LRGFRVLEPLRGALLLALAYYVGAEIAFYIGTLSDQIFALFWPPNVILFFALVIAPPRLWWLYLAAAFPAHVIAETGVGMPIAQLLVAFFTNCLVALLNAYLVQKFVDHEARLDTFNKTLRYIVVTAGVAPAVSALGGAFVPILGGGAFHDYWLFWSNWYMANAVPNVTLGAGFLAWRFDRMSWPLSRPSRRQIEPVLLSLGLVIVCIITVTLARHLQTYAFLPTVLLLPLPLVLLFAFQWGKKGASGALLIVAVILTWYTLRPRGVFQDLDPGRAVLALQLFLTGLSVPVLLLAALIDELRDAEHRQLLLNELNHRVRNTLTAVQAVAMQTFRGKAEPEATEAFQARLMALSGAHDILTREHWDGADLRDIVMQATAPHRGDPSRVRFTGPSIRLLPKSALALAMALHELCTNAVKYGALKGDQGLISIEWQTANRSGVPRLRLRWEESGGPSVREPTKQGFGSRLLRSLSEDLDAQVELHYPSTGVVCTIDAAL
jgi:two-component sensor histidine kinase